MNTATANPVTITNQALTFGDDIRAHEVTLQGVTGSADVHGRIVRIRNSNLDRVRVMAEKVVIDNSNIDTLELQNVDWFWGRIDQVEVEAALSHIYVMKAEHVGTLSLDRVWTNEVRAETMNHLRASHSNIEEMWVAWNTPSAKIEGCAIGRSNLLVVDAGTAKGYRMNLAEDPQNGTVTVTYRGRTMHLGMAREVFEGDAQLSAMLKSGVAQLRAKKEVYS